MAGNSPFRWRGVILLAVALLLIVGAVFFEAPPASTDITVDTFTKLLQQNQVAVDSEHFLRVYKEPNNRIDKVTGFYRGSTGELVRFETKVSPEQDYQVLDALLKSGLKLTIMSESALVRLLPAVIFGIIVVFFVLRIRRNTRSKV